MAISKQSVRFIIFGKVKSNRPPIMIKSTSLLIALAITGTCLAQSDSTHTPVATAALATAAVPEDILVLKETEFDFGKIPMGKPVTHVFGIRKKSN